VRSAFPLEVPHRRQADCKFYNHYKYYNLKLGWHNFFSEKFRLSAINRLSLLIIRLVEVDSLPAMETNVAQAARPPRRSPASRPRFWCLHRCHAVHGATNRQAERLACNIA
jgi:hypothetical protein